METNHTIATLKRLETHYSSALEHVQALLAIDSTVSGASGGLTALTKASAASIVIQENGGAMHKAKILSEMQKRGHPVAGMGALSTMLSTEDRFKGEGAGMWSLAIPCELGGRNPKL